jgi:hypothetical protein
MTEVLSTSKKVEGSNFPTILNFQKERMLATPVSFERLIRIVIPEFGFSAVRRLKMSPLRGPLNLVNDGIDLVKGIIILMFLVVILVAIGKIV